MKPILQAILVADYVYQDARTGKHVIAGTFTNVALAKNVPFGSQEVEAGGQTVQFVPTMTAGSPFVYISLTEVRGQLSLVLRYVDLNDNSILFTGSISLACEDPTMIVEFSMPLPTLPIPHSGAYALELLCGDEWLGSHRINVVEANAKGDQS